jgi:hypothetical protein
VKGEEVKGSRGAEVQGGRGAEVQGGRGEEVIDILTTDHRPPTTDRRLYG